ncbi:MAG: EamA/RhaT family transporter, partial [Rhodobacteraceae bacterium]
QLVFVSVIGVAFFNEVIALNVAIGAGIVLSAGLFTFWRERLKNRAL